MSRSSGLLRIGLALLGARSLVVGAAMVIPAGCALYPTSVRLERAAITGDILGAEAAAYFTVRADGVQPDTVVGLSIAESGTIAMQSYRAHRSLDGATTVPRMVPVEQIPMGTSGALRFAPGGYTGVITGLGRRLAPGDSVRLTVKMASGREASAVAPVLRFDELEAVLDPATHADGQNAPATAAEGGRLYRANGCGSCHGGAGHGDGPVGRGLVPPPRDFRVVESFKGGTEPEQIARTLAVGIPAGGSMPLFAHLSNRERRALALYLVTFRTTPTDRSSKP